MVRLEVCLSRERQGRKGASLNVESYLKRINYSGPLDPDQETLRRLHVTHLLNVPFENFDIHLSRPIVLEDPALFNKIVERRRGGFCYELNGLFCWLLRDLGFKVTMLSAGVARKEGGFDPTSITWPCWLSSNKDGWQTSASGIHFVSRSCWISPANNTKSSGLIASIAKVIG